jgi:flagellar biosynthetic protein FliR
MARVIDPSSSISSTLMASVYMQLFALMFVVVNGHHQVIRLAALSFKTLGAGEFVFTNDMAINVLQLSSRIFQMGLQIAFPIFAVILLINIGMGLMARAAQGFPVLMLSFPLRLGVGLLILISTIPVVVVLARENNLQLLDWVAYLINA